MLSMLTGFILPQTVKTDLCEPVLLAHGAFLRILIAADAHRAFVVRCRSHVATQAVIGYPSMAEMD